MSEYWKSTPRVWCKHCKTFYRDTPFDIQQHNSTGRHQSAVQRSIRNLHKDSEREDRNAQRAKDEVARLNGIVSGKPVARKTQDDTKSRGAQESASEADRKRQIAQLAAMGVAIPEKFRKEMAVASGWQTVSERRLNPVNDEEDGVKQEDEEWERSVGVRKRRHDEDEEDESARLTDKKIERRWGSRVKTYHAEDRVDVDIGALMGSAEQNMNANEEPISDGNRDAEPEIKQEEKEGLHQEASPPPEEEGNEVSPIKAESISEAPVPTVLFKKRKGKVKAGG